MASESRNTVLVALGANALIGVAKLFGGLISGSSAMLAEAAHSAADTLNQVFLLTSLSVAKRPADREHPFGYGKARFFWAVLAAVGIFVAGAVFSLYEGVHTILTGEGEGDILVPYIVLGVSFLAEGTSLLRAIMQVRGEARASGRGFLEYLRRSKDPTVKTVLWEDSAAVTGLLLAAAGIGLHYVTGKAIWDGIAAVAIGVLLAIVAVVLGRETQDLLIGEAADPELVLALYDQLTAAPEVEEVVELLTMHLGPESVLLAARLDLRNELSAAEVEDFSGRMEGQLAATSGTIRQVFLDATRTDRETAERTRSHMEWLREELAI
jgi:cation diffusion facilitator family transporter